MFDRKVVAVTSQANSGWGAYVGVPAEDGMWLLFSQGSYIKLYYRPHGREQEVGSLAELKQVLPDYNPVTLMTFLGHWRLSRTQFLEKRYPALKGQIEVLQQMQGLLVRGYKILVDPPTVSTEIWYAQGKFYFNGYPSAFWVMVSSLARHVDWRKL